MKYNEALKLHNGDEVEVKKTSVILPVVETWTCEKLVMVRLASESVYNHKEIR